MSYKRFQALLTLASVQGLNLQTISDFWQFAKEYSNIETFNLIKGSQNV